jgi:hypothetical protein
MCQAVRAVSTKQQASRRRYRGFVVASAVVLGLAVGVGLGSLAVLAGQPLLLGLLLIPIGWRVVARIRQVPGTTDAAVWLVPVVALPTEAVTYLGVSSELAPLGIAVSIAAWFVLLVAAGILEVVLDPDGSIAGTPE